MTFLDLLFVLVPFIFGGVVYLATNEIILSIIITVISLIYFVFIARNIMKKYQINTKKFYDCYQFINSFIISLSITSSTEMAYESAYKLLSDDTKAKIELISDEHSLTNIKQVLNFSVFSLFLDIVNIWQEQGNDILDASEYVMKETRDIQDIIIDNNRHSIKTALEFFILWIICLAIIVFMRFALKDFYAKILKSQIYIYGIGAIILFIIASVHIFLIRMSKLDLKVE